MAVVGPSGAGKDTLLYAARAARPDLHVPRRVITRAEALGGEDFEGVSAAEFAARQAAGAFAIHWQAHGLHYGVPATIGPVLAAGGTVVFNGSRAVLAQARRDWPGLRAILVTAPPAVLAARLAARGRESADDIAARLGRAGYAMPEGVPVSTVCNGGALADGVAAFLRALRAPVQSA